MTEPNERKIHRTEPVSIGSVTVGGDAPLVLIAGPCVIESRDLILEVAHALREMARLAGMPLIFKSSYDKANRTSIRSYRGPGLEAGLEILAEVRRQVGIPVLTDVHCNKDVERVSQVVDVIQIPAFLCRQTDLVVSAARTGKAVNIKKGQFMAPWDMRSVLEKARCSGEARILVTERGSSFGYNNLVVDYRSLVALRRLGSPVIFDATHSVQLPGGLGESSGGQREYVPYLAKAAVAVGIDGIFMEVHPDPDAALCDGPNSLPLKELSGLLREIVRIDEAAKGR